MYSVYLLEYLFGVIRDANSGDGDIPVYVPNHYTYVRSFEDYVKAYRYADTLSSNQKQAVVIYFNKSASVIERDKKTIEASEALRLARVTLRQLSTVDDKETPKE